MWECQERSDENCIPRYLNVSTRSRDTFAEAAEETGEICVGLEGPSGGLATGTLEVLFTIDTGNINRPAS